MKAAVCRRYGPPDVVTIESWPKPVPGPDDVLIRVRASTVSSADWRIRSHSMPYGFGVVGRLAFGVTAPRQPILGSELAGDVVEIGAAVHHFAVGDAVVAFSGATMGAHAEYRCMRADAVVVRKPPTLSYETAAALAFGGTTALDFFRRGALRAGDRVLINGASGAVGSAMVQLAVAAGAEVTAVCSGANAEAMQQLGAVHVVDYTRVDFAGEGQRYDVIADAVGNAPYSRVRRALTSHGRLLLVLATLPEMLRAPWVNATSRHRIVFGPAAECVDDLRTLVDMAADGRFTPLIDSRFTLTDIAAAHARVETMRKRGSVVVTE
ncbi:NAD(P)-dependent alcohol dehydrogenase [Gemmatimonas groenlandica]|uniref:NAD(P)-dependent alcohol dehydrogenase n=2 Tax=Gemmatimonas groenlandica TaxID=2732249 RepID=A0A6M4IXE9_9BACT|nr:NAD(P)-dependent alcohol dehydrogenase [Gemmatimonas groenlandica]